MKDQPKEAKDLIEKLAQGQQLSPSETKCLNRLLIEANYPLETPKSRFLSKNNALFLQLAESFLFFLGEKREICA